MASFQSTCKSTLRIEAPVWPEIRQAVLPPAQAQRRLEPLRTERVHSGNVAPASPQDHTTAEPADATNADEEAEEEEDDKHVAPEGQGCFSFRQSLLLRAKDTYAARCTGNKYEIISKWLLTGLAVVFSRPNWQFLTKRGTLTATPQHLLQRYYRQGYPAGLVDKKACLICFRGIMPYRRLSGGAGSGGSVIHGTCMTWMPCMLSVQGQSLILFTEQWTSLTPSKLCNTTKQTANKQNKQNKQNKLHRTNKLSEQPYQPNKQWQGQVPRRSPPADRFTTARTSSQCTDRQATVAATGSNQ